MKSIFIFLLIICFAITCFGLNQIKESEQKSNDLPHHHHHHHHHHRHHHHHQHSKNQSNNTGFAGKMTFYLDQQPYVVFDTVLKPYRWKEYSHYFYAEGYNWEQDIEKLSPEDRSLYDFYGVREYFDRPLQHPAILMNYFDVYQCNFELTNQTLKFKLTQPLSWQLVMFRVDFEFESTDLRSIQKFVNYLKLQCQINASPIKRHLFKNSMFLVSKYFKPVEQKKKVIPVQYCEVLMIDIGISSCKKSKVPGFFRRLFKRRSHQNMRLQKIKKNHGKIKIN